MILSNDVKGLGYTNNPVQRGAVEERNTLFQFKLDVS